MPDDYCGKGDGCCMLRECESEAVLPWIRRVLSLMNKQQSAWVVPGLFGSGEGSANSDGTPCCPDAGNFSEQGEPPLGSTHAHKHSPLTQASVCEQRLG